MEMDYVIVAPALTIVLVLALFEVITLWLAHSSTLRVLLTQWVIKCSAKAFRVRVTHTLTLRETLDPSAKQNNITPTHE